MLTSTPKDPTQPSTQFYNIDALYTVSLHTRGGTEANNGPQPPFDMSQAERNWWDDSATGPKDYNIFDGAKFVTKTIDARKPNFKGFPNYPKRTIAPTTAVMPHANGNPTPVDPTTLSTEAEAKALQAELGDVFIESALGERRNTFLLETHSEHLLLRVMRRMRETADQTLPSGLPTVHPDDVRVLYKVSDYYAPEYESGIRWNDPELAMPWPVNDAAIILSDKDRRLSLLKEFSSPFDYDGAPLGALIEREL